MIEIFGIALDGLPSAARMSLSLNAKFLSAHRARHGEIRNERAAQASLAGLLLLQSTGAVGDLVYDDRGRPQLVGAGCDFNVTHTDTHAFCAVETPSAAGEACRVGLDAEDLSRISIDRTARLAERWFSDAEKAVLALAPTVESFLRIWTRKEALMKWVGTGLVDLPRADTVSAETAFGVRFAEYCAGDVLVTLCHRADTPAPQDIRMLCAEEIL